MKTIWIFLFADGNNNKEDNSISWVRIWTLTLNFATWGTIPSGGIMIYVALKYQIYPRIRIENFSWRIETIKSVTHLTPWECSRTSLWGIKDFYRVRNVGGASCFLILLFTNGIIYKIQWKTRRQGAGFGSASQLWIVGVPNYRFQEIFNAAPMKTRRFPVTTFCFCEFQFTSMVN